MNISDPAYVIAALAVMALSGLLALLDVFRRNLRGAATLALRGLGISLLLLALSAPYLEDRHANQEIRALLDISDSLDIEHGEALLERLRSYSRDGALVRVFPFAGDVTPSAIAIETISSYRSLRKEWQRLNLGKSSIVDAIGAIAQKSGSGSLLLASDGFDTTTDESELTAISSAVSVFPIVDERYVNPSRALLVESLYVPQMSPAQKRAPVQTTLRNRSASPQSAAFIITQNGKTLRNETVTIAPNSAIVINTETLAEAEGISEIVATLTPEAREIAPHSKAVFLSQAPREKVLVLNGSELDARIFVPLLRDRAYQVVSEVGSFKAGADLNGTSVVVLNNIARNQLGDQALLTLREYLTRGGSILMLGGERSFGLGGYIGSSLEPAIPLRMLPPQTEQKRLNLAVALVMDKSRSMHANNKIEFAKEAGREVIRNLKDEDFITVICFDDAPYIIVKLGRLLDIRQFAIEKMERLFAVGTTNMMPAIDEARRALVRAPAGRKHMIIMTDGKIPDEGPYYATMIKELRMLGVTVSTVLLGSEADPGMLKTMAQVGGGAFYQTADPRSLPRIFIKDIEVTSGERTLREESDYAVRRAPGNGGLSGINAFPTLRGYVQTRAKEGANLELVVVSPAQRADPLLASAKFGSGKIAAFTSDSNGRWSSNWLPWPGFARFWSEIIDSLRPSTDTGAAGKQFELRHYLEAGKLKLDLAVFAAEEPRSVEAEVTTPRGTKRKLTFTRVVPGRYNAEMADDILPGRYDVRSMLDGAPLIPIAFALSGEEFGERGEQGTNLTFLNRLAAMSGGGVSPSIAELSGEKQESTERQSLTPYVIFAGLFVLLLEVLLREQGFSRIVRPGGPLKSLRE